MKFMDLFAGCGGMSLGFKQAGFESVGFIEFWKPAIDTYQLNFDDAFLISKDIRNVNDGFLYSQTGKIDVIIGGPPCQGFSIAGDRDPSDPRNSLFMEFLRFVDIIKPKYFVMENVEGIYSMRNLEGKKVFNIIMECFEKINYKVDVKVLNSGNYGVPEMRRRVIFMGNNQNKENVFPNHIKKRKRIFDVIKDLGYEENSEINHVYKKGNLFKFSYMKVNQNLSGFKSSGKKLDIYGLAPTITKSGRYVHPIYNRYMSVREIARIQSFPDNFKFYGNIDEMYGMIGNAVPPLMAKEIALCIKSQLEENEIQQTA